jgi:hypothetical protein
LRGHPMDSSGAVRYLGRMANKGPCKADSCEKEAVGKGYCKRHYRLWKRGEMPKARYNTCVAEGCHGKVVQSMRCAEHQKIKPAEEAPADEAAPVEAPAEAPAEEAADATPADEAPKEEAPAEG